MSAATESSINRIVSVLGQSHVHGGEWAWATALTYEQRRVLKQTLVELVQEIQDEAVARVRRELARERAELRASDGRDVW